LSLTPSNEHQFTLSAIGRLKLVQCLSELPVPMFVSLVFALNVPGGTLSDNGTQGAKAAQLLEWITGPTGQDIEVLLELLQTCMSSESYGELEEAIRGSIKNRKIYATRPSIHKQSIELTNQLYKALLRLGYRQQARLFRQVIETNRIAAFLIHGLPDYGQDWLLNRLVHRHVTSGADLLNIKVDLARRYGQMIDPNVLWREMGAHLDTVGCFMSISDTLEKAMKALRTRHIVIILNNAQVLSEKDIQQIIVDFWDIILSHMKNARNFKTRNALLMFLVDHAGKAEAWNIPMISKLERLQADWNPQTPIRPPRLEEFQEDELLNWLEDEFGDLPVDLIHGIDRRVEDYLKKILENSNGGIPEYAFQQICSLCGVNWSVEKAKWIIL
jgi:hypothetical protein